MESYQGRQNGVLQGLYDTARGEKWFATQHTLMRAILWSACGLRLDGQRYINNITHCYDTLSANVS